MKRTLLLISLLPVLALCGCKKMKVASTTEMPVLGLTPMESYSASGADGSSPLLPSSAAASQARKMIWTAEQRVEVETITNAVTAANAITTSSGGYVQNSSISGDDDASLTLRVPSARFNATLASLSALGTSISVKVTSTDITADYVDTEARSKAAIQLRDRLQQLVARATNVHEVLEVEHELSRVQSDIEAMEARLKSMASQADLSTIQLYLVRRTEPAQERIYGPLGLLIHGVGWFVEKLFYIR